MKICDFEKCTGCSACANACPVSCITMSEDKHSFLRPIVDASVCISCKKCVHICPANNPVSLLEPAKVYASWSRDESIHKSSASGGLATLLGKKIVSDGGVVFGAKSSCVDGRIDVSHAQAENVDEVLKFRGSKYVQSNIGDSFKKISKLLKSGRKVLFCGTPCQVAGLKSYLENDYENLITADIVCHGTPSLKLLNRHIEEIVGDKIKNVSHISFRWSDEYCLWLKDKDGSIIHKQKAPIDSYVTGFLSGLFLRKSCYSCVYTQKNRCSDITLGDFWGLGKDEPFPYQIKNGISLCMINTKKGADIINAISDDAEFVERSLSEAVSGNNQLRAPSSERFCSRDKFFKVLNKTESFEKAVKSSAKLARLKYKIINLMK